jgi:polar amino acid transport system substrate-binding protein
MEEFTMNGLKFGLVLGAAMLLGLASANAQDVFKVGGQAIELNGPPGATLTAVAKDAGFEITTTSFDTAGGAIGSLTAGDIDIGIVGTITEEREQVVDFSIPNKIAPEGLVVLANDQTPYRHWEDFKGMAIGALAGSKFPDALRASHLFSEVKEYQTRPELYKAVADGVIKVAIGSPQTRESLDSQGFSTLRSVPTYEPVMVSKLAFAVHKGNKELLDRINASLAKLVDSKNLPTAGR